MDAQKSVLVTGASTGIGRATAVMLAQKGFAVFAGVRSDNDVAKIQQAHANIRPVLLDVTNAVQISAVAQTIGAANIPLAGVVNNAGIVLAGPLEYVALDELRQQFEVNVFGVIAVTQAVLPLLRAANGRIVFMSSVSGQLSPPYVGPYAASKHALESLADSMRMELARFGIAVTVIEPGNVDTPIWAKGRARKDDLLSKAPPEAIERYGDAIEKLVQVTEREERTGIAPEVVAAIVYEALTASAPRARYAVGSPPGWQRKMASFLPERLRDRLILKNFES